MFRTSWRIAPIAVALGLAALRAWFVWNFASQTPLLDEWDINGLLLGRLDAGVPLLSILFARYNVHRIVALRLILLAMLPLSHWNALALLALNFITAAGVAGLLWFVTVRTCGVAAVRVDSWMLAAICVFAFSPAQQDIWLIGDNWTFPGCNLFAIAGLAWLCFKGNSARAFAGAAVFGLLATLSNFHGLFFWPVAALVAAVQGNGPRRWGWMAAWLAVGLLVGALYFSRYDPNPGTSSLFAGVGQFRTMVKFLLGYLGNPVGAVFAPHGRAAHLAIPALGALYLAALAAGALWHWRTRQALRPYLPWLAISAFFLVTAVSVAFGRSRDGYETALMSRYVSMSFELWIAWLVMVYLATAGVTHAPSEGETARPLPRWSYRVLLLGLVGIGLLSQNTIEQRSRSIAVERQRATEEIPDVCDGNFDSLRLVHPDPARIADYLPFFEAHDVAFLRAEPLSAVRIGPEPVRGITARARIEPAINARSSPCLRIDGDFHDGTVREIVAVEGGHVLKRKRIRGPEAQAGTWSLFVSLHRIEPTVPVTLYVVTGNSRVMRPIESVAPIRVDRLPPPGPPTTDRPLCGPDGGCVEFR